MDHYTIQQTTDIPHIGKGAWLLHKQSGAEVCYIQNQDINKVFFIGFKTPPPDLTGVPHILEHSVLCGSKKYPAKDPFNELVKSSFNTYLNAMTYNDKTVYPVASYHQKDFYNLMDVYLDSVFHPLIKDKKEIFYQEGWHYHLETAKDDLTINGVVYNEMKGAYSGPERILADCIAEGIFENGFYRNSSGGIPDAIPNLSYSQFIEYYDRYYHPANSFIYVYGDGNMAQDLAFIHTYLREFTYKEKMTWAPFTLSKGVKKIEREYAIASGESLSDKTYLSYSVPVGKSWDTKLMISLEILANALFNFPGAPVKEAVLKNQIAKEVQASLNEARLQPVFSIVAKNSNPGQMTAFAALLQKEFTTLCDTGFDQTFIKGALSRHRFYYEDKNFGYRPKGLVYGLMMTRSWIYNKNPFQSLLVLDAIQEIEQDMKNGYFEHILKKYFCQNETVTHTVIKPRCGLQEETAQKEKKRLAAYKQSLSDAEIEKIVQSTQKLAVYQGQPDDEALLNKIPYVQLKDIPVRGRDMLYDVNNIGGVSGVISAAEGAVTYIAIHFKLDKVPYGALPYAGLFSKLLSKMPTPHFGVSALAKEINLFTGGIQIFSQTIIRKGALIPVLTIKGKCLPDQLDKLFFLFQEIIQTTVFDVDILAMEYKKQISYAQSKWLGQGHTMGISRAIANVDTSGVFQQAFTGLDYYDALVKMDGDMEALAEAVNQLPARIFTKENMFFQVTAAPQHHGKIFQQCERLLHHIAHNKNSVEKLLQPQHQHEGLILSSKVQHNILASKSWSWQEYNGLFSLAKTIVNRDYLWNTIRIKGGAYGSNIQFTRNGLMYMYSYRDPHIEETFRYFHQLYAYLKNFSCSKQLFQKYIAGTINHFDKPLHQEEQGDILFIHYMMGIQPEDIQKEREEILSACVEDIRILSRFVEKALSEGCYCTIGNEEEIQKYNRYHSIRRVFYT